MWLLCLHLLCSFSYFLAEDEVINYSFRHKGQQSFSIKLLQVNKQKENVNQNIYIKKKRKRSPLNPLSPSATSVLRKIHVFNSSWSVLLGNFKFTSVSCVPSSLCRTFIFGLTHNSSLQFFHKAELLNFLKS